MERARLNPLLLLPPLLFAAFAGLAWFALTRENAGELPSALIGRPAPGLGQIEALSDDPPPTDTDLRAPGVKLVNFWASWCAPCRVEHPLLTEIAASGVPVIGVNYKDTPDNALAFLDELGDPFASVGADRSGRTGLDWGIYGVPETFVVAADGTVLLRHPGPITPDVFERRFAPLLAGEQPDSQR
jgi:cytochrome c biogenesis protein CcmG/thiol:disulfide interchange protein DsbE